MFITSKIIIPNKIMDILNANTIVFMDQISSMTNDKVIARMILKSSIQFVSYSTNHKFT